MGCVGAAGVKRWRETLGIRCARRRFIVVKVDNRAATGISKQWRTGRESVGEAETHTRRRPAWLKAEAGSSDAECLGLE